MASYIVDRETGHYWLYFGKGAVKDKTKAYQYADSIAVTLHRLFWETTYVEHINPNDVPTHTTYKPLAKTSPRVTEAMMNNNLTWVAHEGVWVAADRQHLAIATLTAFEQPKVTG